MVSEDSTSTAAPEVSSAAVASCSRQQRAAVCSVRHNFQNYMKWNGNTRTILCQSEYERTPPHPKQTHIEKHFCIYGNSLWTCELDPHEGWYIGHGDCATHRAPTHLPAGIEGVSTHASLSLLRMSTGVLCLAHNGDWRSRTLKKYLKCESTRMDGTGLS